MEVALTVVGAVLGLVWGGTLMALAGAALGYLLGNSFKLRKQLLDLDRRLLRLEGRPAATSASAGAPRAVQAAPVAAPEKDSPESREATPAAKAQPVARRAPSQAPPDQPPREQTENAEPRAKAMAEPGPPSSVPRASDQPGEKPDRSAGAGPRSPGVFESIVEFVYGYFRSGNLIVRIGVIILFFGVSFLLKYAAEHTRVPIEFRLSAVAAAAVGLLIFGWRLRNRRQNYGLVLQGGAVGILYLTVFSALRLYSVLPAGGAFVLMLAFVALSALLALLQNARSLAVLGSIGGFLAPLLVSTGQGSPVTLFGYYLLLNVGILAIAWVKSWRLLNLVGFAFTFIIGAVWGYQFYTPQNFATIEPFLVAFFLLYVAVSVLFAHTQSLALKGLVDGALIFGVPLAVAGLQGALVRDQEYGLAISAIVLGAFYIALAGVLFRRSGPPLRTLSETFLAIGVVFATLSIPFALDGRVSAAFWALEGAAAVWLGLRQSHLLPRLFGVALQFLAGLLYLSDLRTGQAAGAVLNGGYLGAVLIAFGGLLIAGLMDRHAHKRHAWEHWQPVALFSWGLFWWLSGNVREILVHTTGLERWIWLLYLVSATAALAEFGRAGLHWPRLRHVFAGLLPALVLLALAMLGEHKHLLAGGAAPAWLLALVVFYLTLRRREETLTDSGVPFAWWHLSAAWLVLVLVMLEASWRLDQWVQGAVSWKLLPLAAVPVLAGFFIFTLGRKIPWPFAAYYRDYVTFGMLPVALVLAVWLLLVNTISNGNSQPLPYLPVLNPTDLGSVFVLIFLLRWRLEFGDWLRRLEFDEAVYFAIVGALAFYWLNGMTLRSVQQWSGLPFDLSELLRSRVLQTSLTVLWALCGLGCMLAGTRGEWRRLWIAGAGLMAVVVFKLFVVDLSGTGTVERIVSFIGVGLLLLIVGWFSPVPPGGQRSHS